MRNPAYLKRLKDESHFLATKVMGYGENNKETPAKYIRHDGRLTGMENWNPRQNISQATLLLDKYPQVEISKHDVDKFVVTLITKEYSTTPVAGETLQEAIVKAVLMDSGYQYKPEKEEGVK